MGTERVMADAPDEAIHGVAHEGVIIDDQYQGHGTVPL
jgi:hypothetical protein